MLDRNSAEFVRFTHGYSPNTHSDADLGAMVTFLHILS